MRFALVNGEKTEPMKNGRGDCLCCGGEVIAKCGQFKVHHWAHKDKLQCDPWWENESEWHRKWKSHFPEDWQERIFFDPKKNENHIADVYSELRGVAIEFQSYQLKLDELVSRENFYEKLIWVVNGDKNESDRFHFINGLRLAHTSDRSLRKIIWYGRGKLLERWAGSRKKVYIDFGDKVVWHLLEFNPSNKEGLVKSYMKNKFIKFFGGEESGLDN